MKTFETEKGNIPSGATHYSEENDTIIFCWFKMIDENHWGIMTAEDLEWHKCDCFEWKRYELKEISQTKNADWDGEGFPSVGVECWFNFKVTHPQKCKVKYIGKTVCVYESADGNEYSTLISEVGFSKIETPQQREDRERLEAAYDLYCIMCDIEGYAKFDLTDFSKTKKDSAVWLAIVDKTNYRKEVK